jgi:hypothetical protein
VQVKNKPCLECIVIMCLISWNHSRGSETIYSYIYLCRYIIDIYMFISIFMLPFQYTVYIYTHIRNIENGSLFSLVGK